MGYLIAAYAIVVGSLLAYALWLYNERRKLRGQDEQDPNDPGRL